SADQRMQLRLFVPMKGHTDRADPEYHPLPGTRPGRGGFSGRATPPKEEPWLQPTASWWSAVLAPTPDNTWTTTDAQASVARLPPRRSSAAVKNRSAGCPASTGPAPNARSST